MRLLGRLGDDGDWLAFLSGHVSRTSIYSASPTNQREKEHRTTKPRQVVHVCMITKTTQTLKHASNPPPHMNSPPRLLRLPDQNPPPLLFPQPLGARQERVSMQIHIPHPVLPGQSHQLPNKFRRNPPTPHFRRNKQPHHLDDFPLLATKGIQSRKEMGEPPVVFAESNQACYWG